MAAFISTKPAPTWDPWDPPFRPPAPSTACSTPQPTTSAAPKHGDGVAATIVAAPSKAKPRLEAWKRSPSSPQNESKRHHGGCQTGY